MLYRELMKSVSKTIPRRLEREARLAVSLIIFTIQYNSLLNLKNLRDKYSKRNLCHYFNGK